MCLQEQLAEIILRAMEGEARKRLFSLFADDNDAGGEIEQLENERDGSGGSRKMESSQCNLESAPEIESVAVSRSVSDSEIDCSEIDESESGSDCSSQVSVIMRAPETAVLNWLKGIEVNLDVVNGVEVAEHEIGEPRQHSHNGEGDGRDTARETGEINWSREIEVDDGELSDMEIKGSIQNGNDKKHMVVALQKDKSQNLKQIECNHQNCFDFVEEEMTFIINVMPAEQAFDPFYKVHTGECSLVVDISEMPSTSFASHHFDQAVDPNLEVETEESVYKKENKKPSSLVENRLSRISEEEESQQGEVEPKKKEMDEENRNEKKDPETIGDYSFQNGDNSSREVEACNGEQFEKVNSDSEPSFLPNSLSPSCYELEDVEENEFEYIEVEDKIESFPGAIGFAILRRKN